MREIKKGIEWVKEKIGEKIWGFFPRIQEDPINEEHLKLEKKVKEVVSGKTSPESFPLLRRELTELCQEIQKERGKNYKIIIIDVGCSTGHNTIKLAEELKKAGVNFCIIAIDQISERIKRAREKYFFSERKYNTKFYHCCMTSEGIKDIEGKLIKADFIKATDLSPSGREELELLIWAAKNLKEGGYLLFANTDVSEKAFIYKWEKGKLNCIKEVEDISYSWEGSDK